MTEELRSAVAAGVLGAEAHHRSLLQSIVEVARAIFGAKASSIFLLDEANDELVFEAVAGEGAGTLLGRRFPSSTGIAGWVLVTQQPLVLENVADDPRFGREAAESTGFVPKAVMAVPLLHDVPRTATVRARTDVELLALDRDEFIGAVTGHPESAEAAHAVVAARLASLRPSVASV